MKRFIGCLSILLVGCSATSSDVTASGDSKPDIVETVKADKTIMLGVGVSTMAHTLLTGQLDAEPYTDTTKAMQLTFTATNTQQQPVSIRFNSGMTADLWLYNQKGQKVWASSQDMMYTQALRDVTLAPAKTIVSRFSVPAAIMNEVKDSGYRFEVKFAGKASDGSDAMLLNLGSTPLIVK